MKPKIQADLWQIRCTRCDFSKPWDKPVARTKSAGRKFIFGRCSQCKRIRFHIIEKAPDPNAKAP